MAAISRFVSETPGVAIGHERSPFGDHPQRSPPRGRRAVWWVRAGPFARSLTMHAERAQSVRLGSNNSSRTLTNPGETGGYAEKRPSVRVVVVYDWRPSETRDKTERWKDLNYRAGARYGRRAGLNKERERCLRRKLWLPVVDAFRTFLLAPPPEGRVLLAQIQEFMADPALARPEMF